MDNHRNENREKRSLKDGVLGAIRDNTVRMRPRWHFVLRAALSVTGLALAFLFAVYMASLAIFFVRFNGGWFAAPYGAQGLRAFLLGVPWAVVVVAVVFLGIVHLLVKHYSFAYRRPLLYSALAVVAVVAIGGFLVARTGFHGGLLSRAHDDRLPLAGAMYRRLERMRPERLYRGVVEEATGRGFEMIERDGEELEVIVRPSTRIPPGWAPTPEAPVIVIGEQVDATIIAEGVLPIGDDAGVPRPRRGQGGRSFYLMPPPR